MSKIHFLVFSWVFKAQNAPKPRLVVWGVGSPHQSSPPRRRQRLDLAAFGASLLTLLVLFS